MCDKELSDYFNGEGWVECWICPKCGTPWPPYFISCPYCDPTTGRVEVGVKYNENTNGELQIPKTDYKRVDCQP